jgi:hypothetical protein
MPADEASFGLQLFGQQTAPNSKFCLSSIQNKAM